MISKKIFRYSEFLDVGQDEVEIVDSLRKITILYFTILHRFFNQTIVFTNISIYWYVLSAMAAAIGIPISAITSIATSSATTSQTYNPYKVNQWNQSNSILYSVCHPFLIVL